MNVEFKLEEPPFIRHITDNELAHHTAQAWVGLVDTTTLVSVESTKNDIDYTFIDNFSSTTKWAKAYIDAIKYTPDRREFSIRMVDDNYQDVIPGKVIDKDNFYKEFKPSRVYWVDNTDREFVRTWAGSTDGVFIRSAGINRTWSLYDLDNLLLLINGYHLHSKVKGYVITDKPWDAASI